MTCKVLETNQSVLSRKCKYYITMAIFLSTVLYNIVCICDCLLFQSAQYKLAI